MESMDLTGVWHFQPDLVDEGEVSGFFLHDYDHTLWREVWVPSDFDTCHPSLESYEGGAWYRTIVTIPQSWQDRRIVLHFEGCNARLKAWVNGHLVGTGNMPYLPFDFEIQNYCEPENQIVIAVWVDNRRLAGEVPGKQRGWRTFGGLLREVVLISTDKVYLDKIVATAEPGEAGGKLAIQAVIRNKTALQKHVALKFSLTDKNGEVWETISLPSRAISAKSANIISTEIEVSGAHLWSPQSPHLYTLDLALNESERCIHTHSMKIGFRKIEVQRNRILLNGLPIYLTGFNRHEDSITHNMCVDLETARSDFEQMKEAGANFVRLCHYPHHPGTVSLCDELGLLVMDEIPLYWWDGLSEGETAYANKLEAASEQLRTLIQRDRNHPSVIFWSVSNETKEERPEVVVGNVSLIALAKKLDPSRLVGHVSDHWQENPQFEDDDVIFVNGYPTLGEKIAQKNFDFAAVDGGNFWREKLHELQECYPDKPIVVTEFGYVSIQGVYEGITGEITQAEVISQEYIGIQSTTAAGAVVWCWADHPWPAATFQFANYLANSHYGIVTRSRRKKRPYWVIAQLFREKQGVVDPPKIAAAANDTAGVGVYMMRFHMNDIPQYAFPEGYGIRNMRLDDGGLWSDIWQDADPETGFDKQLFHREFSYHYQATTWRSFIVMDSKGLGVGIISAWYNQMFKGGLWGQIHWVALRKSVWGLGLGKAMMTHAMNYLAERHSRAYLGTQTNRLAAIKNYLDFGFVPYIEGPKMRDAWKRVGSRMCHQTLADLGLCEIDD